MNIEVAGEALVLSAGRALFRPRTRQLLIADPHFGKAEAFRARGVPVPEGTTLENLARIDTLIAEYMPLEVVFLGDFLHARVAEVFKQLLPWRQRHDALTMRLVRGNHDAKSGEVPAELSFHVTQEHLDPPFVYRHVPGPSPHGFTLAGHLHPAYRLRGLARESLRLSCFWLTAGGMVLPAFGEFTGCMEITRAFPGDQIFVVAGERVYEA